jgi:uncharacterized membrane protein YidH (DUF202 family)
VPKSRAKSQVIALVGSALALVGLTVAATLRASSFARYMWFEDLGLDVDPAVSPELFRQIVATTPTDKALFYIALALIPIGVFLLVLGMFRHKRMGGDVS